MTDVKIKVSGKTNSSKPKRKWFGVRHYQFLLLFINLVIFYGIRTSLSVAIISMTAKTSSENIPSYPDWNNSDTILSSFFWGYIVTQLFAGQLAERFGPKWFVFTMMVMGGIANVIVPVVAASFGSIGVIVCRVVQGLNQGFLYPCTHSLISRWAPYHERARISSFVYGGSSIGIISSMIISGSVCGSSMGWPMLFYGYGAIGVLWALVFVVFAKNSPSEHKTISEEERNYIEESNSVTKSTKITTTPWKSILTSLPIWATFMSGAGSSFGGFTLLTEIPTYMSKIMKFDIKSNSALSSLPYIAQFVLGLLGSFLADKILEKKIISVTNCRKLFNGLASYCPAAALIWLAFIDQDQKELGVFLLVVSVGTGSFITSGYFLNFIDLAPNYTGTLMGTVNGSNTIFSILGPLTVSLFGTDKSDPILWRKVFLLSAGLYAGCGAFYTVFASSKLQPWNEPEKEKPEKK